MLDLVIKSSPAVAGRIDTTLIEAMTSYVTFYVTDDVSTRQVIRGVMKRNINGLC